MKKIKICAWCSGEFTPRVARQKYCKRRCKELAMQSRGRGGTGARQWVRGESLADMSEEDRKAYHKLRNRVSALKELGWTMEALEASKQAQSSRCAICNDEVELVPDHKHTKPPMPRALLCRGCNSAIGMLKESPERCESAAAYLKHWQTPGSKLGI